tara:strand:+ start:1322 stop:2404 length:1083 start_codon:yes stop_codon:yes gene_type:complete
MIVKKYQKYLVKTFFYNFIIVSLVFLSLGFILNFFEELKFFNDHQANAYYPFLLALLNTPSVLFELFPFIFLITTKFFYIYLNDRNEIEILKNNGISYLKILSILSIFTFCLGAIILVSYYTFSSNLKYHYYNLKNNFTEQNEYLAVVNESGLWIKEEIDETFNIIHAKQFKENLIEKITITQTNSKFKMPSTIIAEKANISKKMWDLINVKIINHKGEKKNLSNLQYKSSFNGEIVANLFSNLNSLNLYQLYELSENYSKIGYSTTNVMVHLNKLYSLPIFFLLMTVLGFLIMIKFKFIKTKFFTVIIGVIISVTVYYLNYFSSLFGSNETLPIGLSIWLPHLILLLTCSLFMVRINEL